MEMMGLSDLPAVNARGTVPFKVTGSSNARPIASRRSSQIAGLLHPAQIVVSGEFPSSYAWAEELYGRLGSADKFRRVKTMSDWA